MDTILLPHYLRRKRQDWQNHEMHVRTGVVVIGLLARFSPVPRDFRRSGY